MSPVTVIFHRLALREYQDACQWYARRSPQAAQRFIDAVSRAVQAIAAAPSQWPVYRGPYRWVRTQRFPYLLYYRILDPARVLLVAVAHTRRRPGYWLRRRP
jgi:plasmid stabilization system protein ParE